MRRTIWPARSLARSLLVLVGEWQTASLRADSSHVSHSEQWNCNSCFPKYCKMLRLTSNFLFLCVIYIFKISCQFYYVCSSIHHSPQKEVSPQNRHLRLCPKECVLIFAQIKENKLCTHSRFFIRRQTSLFIVWNLSILSLLEAQTAQVSVAKKSFFL